jgi:hypothetical protein
VAEGRRPCVLVAGGRGRWRRRGERRRVFVTWFGVWWV